MKQTRFHLNIFICLTLALIALLPSHTKATTTAADTTVGIVVVADDGTTQTACIDMGSATEITGMQALLATGFDVVVQGDPSLGGGIVCKIAEEGCDYPDEPCFCESFTTGKYWSYWHVNNGAWQYAVEGATGHKLYPGDIDGWIWGKDAPADVPTLDDICASDVTPIPLPTPSATPIPSATPTPSPTATATDEPSPTYAPTATATDTPLPSVTSTMMPTYTATMTPTYTATMTPTHTPIISTTVTATTTTTSTASPSATATTESGSEQIHPIYLPIITSKAGMQ